MITNTEREEVAYALALLEEREYRDWMEQLRVEDPDRYERERFKCLIRRIDDLRASGVSLAEIIGDARKRANEIGA